ncbi:hypothetical protein Zm00014a_025623 [Zea mays]|uniref:Uncharacterized protein n=1 Tax=Zea mays TaxID=4577 RepID=A0A317Y9R0_MAIZE|nr:hypothetical protein Zm00014a_025623 [Zea mays]
MPLTIFSQLTNQVLNHSVSRGMGPGFLAIA